MLAIYQGDLDRAEGSGTATLVNHGELLFPMSFAWYEGFDQIEPFYNVTRSGTSGGGSVTLMGPFNGISSIANGASLIDTANLTGLFVKSRF